MATTTTSVFLDQESDWDPWLQIKETEAQKGNVWAMMNPNTPWERIPKLEKPARPTPNTVKSVVTTRRNSTGGASSTPSTTTATNLTNYAFSDLSTAEQGYVQQLLIDHQYDLKEYDKQRDSLAEMRAKIQNTIHRRHLGYTKNCPTVWHMMVNLKQRFAPTDKARELTTTAQWLDAIATPKQGTNLEQWLQTLQSAYDLAVEQDVPYVAGLQAHYAFTNAIAAFNSQFADRWEENLNELAEEEAQSIPFAELVRRFRNTQRLHKSRAKVTARHGAFGATLNGMNANGTTEDPPCVCGQKHRYSKCFYLIESIRPSGWRPNQDVQRRIDAALGKNPKLKHGVLKAQNAAQNNASPNQANGPAKGRSESVEFDSTRPTSTGNASEESHSSKTPLRRNFMTHLAKIDEPRLFGSFQVSENLAVPKYELHASTILDSGSDCHIGNDASRFSRITPPRADQHDHLIAGDSLVPIEGYGSMTVIVQTPGYPAGRAIVVNNAIYAPTFHCSIVSLRLLNKFNVFWENRRNRLVQDDESLHFADTPIHFGQWVLEYNPVPDIPYSVRQASLQHASFKAHSTRHPRPKNVASLDDWHEMMGHLYPEALLKMRENCQGVVITTTQLTNHLCEDCCLNDSKKCIYRHGSLKQTLPFAKVYWDLIILPDGFGSEKATLHFVDDASRMHFAYHVLGTKEEHLLPSFQHFSNYVERRWDLKVKVFHGDGETTVAMGNGFTAWINTKGFVIETSPPHTQDQNGSAERSGGVIIGRARKMRYTANLPQMLWPEIISCAVYLLNRSPTKSLKWETPIGYIERYVGNAVPLPSLNHLVPYGCRAYSYIKKQDKLEKLQARAHIGYLVGYQSTNVFRIWIPTLRTVISTRDVVFDTTKRYNPQDDQSTASIEVVRTIKVLTQDIEDTIEDWALLPPLRSFERTIEKPGDTIVVDEAIQKAANTLITPRDTPEPETEQAEMPAPEHTSPPAERQNSQRNRPEESRADPEALTFEANSNITLETDEIRTEPFTSTSRQNSVKPPNSVEFERQELESKRASSKGAASGNIIESRMRTRKPAAFQVQQMYDRIDEIHFSPYHTSFATGSVHRMERTHSSDLPRAPKHMKQLSTHKYGKEFLLAAQKEWDTLNGQGTFKKCSITGVSMFILPLMWVFTYKLDVDGFLDKFKARLVVRGDLQVSEFKDTYAATLAARIFRAMMAIAAYFDLDMHQFDAINAFCNAAIDEVIYVRWPDGFQVPETCLLLQRALYGLPRSPLLWENLITKYMVEELDLHPVPGVNCIYTNNKLIVFFYVDDIVVLSLSSDRLAYDQFRTALMGAYKMRDMGELKWFLGIRVVRDRLARKIWLCQDSYLTKLAQKFPHQAVLGKRPQTPMSTDTLHQYTGQASKEAIKLYSQIVGSLTYGSTITRPDTAFTTSKLASFLQNPSPEHLKAAYRCLDYLEDTKYFALEFGGPTAPATPVFTAASDAAFADDEQTRRSTEGSEFKLFNGTIDWQSRLQTTVTTSTTEAELLGVSHICAWLLWWARFFLNIELNIDQKLTVHCDNLQTVGLLMKDTPKLVTKLKHIDIHQHWIRQETAAGNLIIEWISTSEMPADGLTMALTVQKHKDFITHMNLVDIQDILTANSTQSTPTCPD